ncbi:Tyrosine-protein kinase transforming protein erbB [Tolypocladium capitatum]|uniref:EKC/KEOPS complex subunit BUD32 n=1 Tax=Tolypocladium capitatum TaxID=45235 RepID=A0A2K3Q795_9HYPO|nr:Tyrosine-protein kinase transforming protein erbB [Tolypocladium capitatum]
MTTEGSNNMTAEGSGSTTAKSSGSGSYTLTGPPPGVKTYFIKHPPNSNPVTYTNFSCLYELDERPNQLCKVPTPLSYSQKAHAIERRIYQRLGEHPNLVKVIKMDEYGIWLERALHGCLRQYHMDGGEATPLERLQWCEDVARVLDFIHGKNVRHADLSGRNLLVDAEKRILLCDFSGSFIDDVEAMIRPEAGFRHPDGAEHSLPTMRGEIHALGSTIYEIITGEEPHKGVDPEAIDELLTKGEYPDVTDVLLGEIIRRCWDGDFDSALDVAKEIGRHRKIQGQIEDCHPGF